jgi:hypothetical protein
MKPPLNNVFSPPPLDCRYHQVSLFVPLSLKLMTTDQYTKLARGSYVGHTWQRLRHSYWPSVWAVGFGIRQRNECLAANQVVQNASAMLVDAESLHAEAHKETVRDTDRAQIEQFERLPKKLGPSNYVWW